MENYKGYNIEINQDEHPESPREWDNLGTMYCSHRNYNLGDNNYNSGDELFESLAEDYKLYDSDGFYIQDRDKILDEIKKQAVILPLYIYEHGGITINTGGYSCRWDSGQVGYIIVSYNDLRDNYNWKNITKKRIEKIEGYLIQEVKNLDNYFTGNVYAYTIWDKNGIDYIDTCCGFYGSDYEENGLMENAKSHINWHIKNEQAKKQEQLKTYIKNSVPLEFRWV